MLLKCCLIHLNTIILRQILYLVYLGGVLVCSCMCKGSENIIKKFAFLNKSQVLLHISIYIKETGKNLSPTAMKFEFD